MGHKRHIIIPLAVVAIVAGGVYGYHIVNQPVAGTIVAPSPVDDVVRRPSDKQLENTYFTAKYPAAYSLQQTDPNATTALEYWRLVAHQGALASETMSISLMVARLPSGGVTESSPYKLYSSRPEQYKLTQASYGGQSVWEAVQQGTSYQRVILWPHNGFLLTVGQVAGLKSDAIDADVQVVLGSLHWRI